MPRYSPVSSVPVFCQASPEHIELVLSGASQELVPAPTAPDEVPIRIILINQSTANLAFFSFDIAAVANSGLTLGFIAAAGGGNHIWDSGEGPVTSGAINVIGTAGQRVSAIIFRDP